MTQKTVPGERRDALITLCAAYAHLKHTALSSSQFAEIAQLLREHKDREAEIKTLRDALKMYASQARADGYGSLS